MVIELQLESRKWIAKPPRALWCRLIFNELCSENQQTWRRRRGGFFFNLFWHTRSVIQPATWIIFRVFNAISSVLTIFVNDPWLICRWTVRAIIDAFYKFYFGPSNNDGLAEWTYWFALLPWMVNEIEILNVYGASSFC